MKFPFQLRHEEKHKNERADDERRYAELVAKLGRDGDLSDVEGELVSKLAAKLGRDLGADANEESKPLAYVVDADVRQDENDGWEMYYRNVMVDAHLSQLTPLDKLPFDVRARIEPKRVAHEARVRDMDAVEQAMQRDGKPIIKIRKETICGEATNLLRKYRFIRHERQSPVDFQRAIDRLTYHGTPIGVRKV